MNWKKMLKTPEGAAFLSAFGVGFFAHLFGIVNVIHNYDSVFSMPYDYGGGIPLGRWGLQLMGEMAERMGGNCNVPLVNGVLFLLLVALSAGFLISVFSIRDVKHAALIGMLFAVFPTSASVLIHRYCAVYYGISMLLSVLAVWVFHRYRFGPALSVLLIMVSLSIYQAFAPITISAFVLLMIQQALRGEGSFFSIVKRGLYYCAVLLLGFLIYYGLQQVAMDVTGIAMDDYQGISDMGHMSLSQMLHSAVEALYLVVMLPMRDYCGLADTAGLRLAWVLLGGLTVVIMGYVLVVKVKKPLMIALTAVLAVLFLLAVNFIYVMCPGSIVYTLMLYPMAMLVCAPIVALECLPEGGEKGKKIASKLIALGMAVLIFSYSYLANTNYTAMYYANRQAENYMIGLVTQIRMTEGYDTEKEWAFIGDISDPNIYFLWQPEITYGGFTDTKDLLACHSTFSWMQAYLGYHPKMASDARIAELAQLEEVKDMPLWPNAGSIKAIGDTMVIKCQEQPNP